MTAPREDPIAVLLDRFPGPQALQRSMSKWLRLLAIGIVFVALGIAFIHSPGTFSDTWVANGFGAVIIGLGLAHDTMQVVREVGWAAVVFFGIGCLVSVLTLIPGTSGLTLGKEGFVIRNLFRRISYQWPNVGEFAVVTIKYGAGSKKLVGFNDRLAATSTGAAINVKLTGRNSALPDTYNLSVKDLARLMTLWRERVVLGSK